ncbi:MAG: tRNA pseudouridine(55) synthase TruB [Hyphomicrobiaceae bacterium]|nr:tRNA pseudouridine(55) synthase TruB [Hyphomicrobiaceae bacterium]
MTGENQQKRPKRDISGWLVLNKPFDVASTEAVGKVRWLYAAKKAGHAGTLDPLATGVLPIALGEATKTVPYIQDGTKVYQFTVSWGAATSTDDREGEVVATSDVRPEEVAVLAALPRFTGEIIQVPPAFSAIRIGGERAYDLARAGEKPDMPPRQVVIDRFDLIEHGTEESRFEVECAKGTYVRALARDLAEALGTKGHVSALHRARVGPFSDTMATGLADLEAMDPETRDATLKPIAAGLEGLAEIALTADQAARVRLGNPVLLTGASAPLAINECYAGLRGKVVAIGYIEKGQFHPSRIVFDA